MDADAEDDQHRHGEEQHVEAGEGDQSEPFKAEHRAHKPGAPAQSPADAEFVGEHPAERAGEEVHQSEGGGGDAGEDDGESELVVEVDGEHAVHGQLDAEAAAVDHEEGPDAAVAEGVPERAGRVLAGDAALRAELFEVAFGGVLGEAVVGDAGEEEGGAGDDHRDAPAQRFVGDEEEDGGHDERHDELGDAAAEVAPAGGGGVGRADDVGGEHDRGVVLGDHEGCADHADQQAEDEECLVVLREADQHHGDCAEQQQGGVGAARSGAVQHPADRDAGDDGDGDGGDHGGEQLLGAEPEVFAHGGQQRRDAEPAEEAEEEGEPGEVEGAHVRRLEAEEPN